jgi:hypothetical protein
VGEAAMKKKKYSYREQWFNMGMANAFRIAGIALGRTHRLEGDKLIPLRKKTKPKKAAKKTTRRCACERSDLPQTGIQMGR